MQSNRLLFIVAALVLVTGAILLVFLRPVTPDRLVYPKATPPPGAASVDPARSASNSSGEGNATQAPLAVKGCPEELLQQIAHNQDLRDFCDKKSKRRATADLNERIEDITTEAEAQALTAVLLDETDDDTVRNEAMNLLRRFRPDLLDANLLQVINRDEPERIRSFACQHLGVSLVSQGSASPLLPVVRNLMRDQHVAVRREALFALFQVKDAPAIEAIRSGLSDERFAGQQDLAIRLLFELGAKDKMPAIREFIKSQVEAECIVAINVAASWKDAESIPLINSRADDAVPRIRETAQAAIQSLADR